MSRGNKGPQPVPSPPPPARRQQGDVGLPAWDLRRYLVRLRCEPKSREARCDRQQRRRQRDGLLAGPEQRGQHGGEFREDGGGEVFDEEGVDDEDYDGDGGDLATRDVFATWGKRIRAEKAEKARARKR